MKFVGKKLISSVGSISDKRLTTLESNLPEIIHELTLSIDCGLTLEQAIKEIVIDKNYCQR